MLQVFVLFNCIGNGSGNLPSKERTLLVGVFDGLTNVIIHIIQGLMKMAPLAVFCLLLSTGAKLGWDVITVLGQYVHTYCLAWESSHLDSIHLLVKTLTKHSPIIDFFRPIAPAQLLLHFHLHHHPQQCR